MDILIKPVVTEKMERLTNKVNQFAFIVDRRANKLQIKKAVEDLYNVTVASVNTMRYAGKVKTRYTRTGYVAGRTSNYKKAIITLKEGETIDFYSNI
ncbi:MAG: 50S ribosomal protein L23 [Bacteroidales bacterium]|nr:50S ribosomal protein L23 [Bacteroidales bacterium]HPD96372.1 50S ribosomal protein L23 [Tenuifilaceae bacterium]HRX30439.1 50S ribosomal protein L23 [Tenuifilaceae bacterium]